MSVEDEVSREYRQKMRRSFDALNEEAARGKQNRRPYNSLNVDDENKREMRNFFMALNEGKLDSMLRAVSPNVVDHSTPAEAREGIDGVRDWFAMLHNGFPDLNADVAEMAIDGDKVVAHVRFTGTHTNAFGDIAATGKQLTLNSTETVRFEGGKHVERWSDLDTPAIIQQVGAGTSA